MDITSYLLGKNASSGGGGGDVSEYFTTTISSGDNNRPGMSQTLIKLPAFEFNGNNCSYMFAYYQGKEVDLRNFVFSNVNTMQYMFYNCNYLETVKLPTSRTNICAGTQNMFKSCGGLKTIDLSGLITNKIMNMDSMFWGCASLTSVNLGEVNATALWTIANLFRLCRSLVSLDLSGLTVGTTLTTTNYAFFGCTSLQHLDIRNMDFTSVTSYTSMFDSVPANCEIIVKDDTQKTWITSKYSNLTNVKTVAEL